MPEPTTTPPTAAVAAPAAPAKRPTPSTLTGPQKAAVLLLGLDETVATTILRRMPPHDLKRLVHEVETLHLNSPDELEAVFAEFTELMQRPVLPGTGKQYMRRLAAAAIGADSLDRLLAPAAPSVDPMTA